MNRIEKSILIHMKEKLISDLEDDILELRKEDRKAQYKDLTKKNIADIIYNERDM